MAKSKTRKDRKPYKPNKMEKMPPRPVADFEEVPTWKPDEVFVVSGRDFQQLYNMYNFFAPFMHAVQNVFNAGVKAGKISPVYLKKDGTPAPAEEVEAFQRQMQEYMMSLSKGAKSQILNPQGEAVSSDEASAEDEVQSEEPSLIATAE